MAIEVVVFDSRLETRLPKGAKAVPRLEAGAKLVGCDGSTALAKMVNDVATLAKTQGRISKLRIMSHAYTHQGRGGYGLKLCKEDLKLVNVNALIPWSGRVDRIFVYGCRAADQPAARDPNPLQGEDGAALISKIAQITRADVVASNAPQLYEPTRGPLATVFDQPWELDPGDWEGVVRIFHPDGSSRLYDAAKEGN